MSVLGARTARLVTHMDVDDDGIDRAVDVLSGAAVRLRPASEPGTELDDVHRGHDAQPTGQDPGGQRVAARR